MRALPEDVQDEIGFDLFYVQRGLTPDSAKPLKGFGGANVLEIVCDYNTNTYRAVYTVRFTERVYALHVFQKKSKSGTALPKTDAELIKSRLKLAEEMEKARREKMKRPAGKK